MKDILGKIKTCKLKGSVFITSFFLLIFFSLFCAVFIFKNSYAESSEDTIAPRTPQGLEVQSKAGGFDIAWHENSENDIFSYLIYLRTGDEKEDSDPILVGKTNNYSIENLNSEVNYYVSLAAKDSAGNISKATPEIGMSPDATNVIRDYSVSAWMPLIDLENSKKSLFQNIDLFDYISPHEMKVEADGSITRVGTLFDEDNEATLNDASVKIIPTITNIFDQDDITSNLLQNEELVNVHVNNILNLVEEENYDGIDIDYENLKPEVKDQFTEFIKKLSQGLHNKDKILSVAVQAKKSDDNSWRGPGAVDYAAISGSVDQLRVMTYDYSRLNTPPGPIAPIDWFRDALKYAKKHTAPEKVIAGIPFYGYKWCLDGDSCEKKGLVYEGVQNIIKKYDPKIEWNERTKAPWFLYVDDNENKAVVNYEDHKSLKEKLKVIQDEEIGGVAIWRLGSEDPLNFEIMRDMAGKNVTVPQNVAVKPGNREINISWQKEEKDKLFGYRVKIYPKEETDKEEEQTFELIDKTEYNIPNLENNKAYYVLLTPLMWDSTKISGFVESSDSAKLVLVTPSDLIYPGTINDFKAEKIDNTSIDLSFTETGDDYFEGRVEKYEIRYLDEPINSENLNKAEVYPNSLEPVEPYYEQKLQMKGLEPGVEYFIAVRAFDENKNFSNISNIVTIETVDNIAPKSLEAPEIIAGNSSLFVKWQASEAKDIAGYKLFWKQENSYYDVIEVDKNTTSYQLDNLENNYDYYVGVSAFDDKGNESHKSVDTQAMPKASNFFDQIDNTIQVASERMKAEASVFSKRIFSEGAVPYLIMFSVIIINVIIYHSIKREVQKKIDKNLNKSLNRNNVSQKKSMHEVRRVNKRVMKF